MERLTSPSQPPAPPCCDPVPNFSDDECGEAKGGRVERLRRGGSVFPKRKNINNAGLAGMVRSSSSQLF